MAKRKKIGDRISYTESENTLKIDIVPGVPEQKINILMFWLVLWSFIGVSLIFYLITQTDIPQETKAGIIVLIGFFLYYEYRMLRAYRWLKYGREELKFEDDSLTYASMVGKRGIPVQYDVRKMGEIKGQTLDEKSFRFQMENSFWIIGTGRMFFNYQGSDVYFGKKMDEKSAKKLALVIEKFKSGRLD